MKPLSIINYLKFSIVVLFLILGPCLIFVYPQDIKLNNGVSISSMNSCQFDLLNKPISSYSIFAGCDYLQHKYFYLSSEIGYLKKGGTETNDLSPYKESMLVDSWDFLQMNTTFRVKTQGDAYHAYLGLGGKVDFLMGSGNFTDELYSKLNNYSINKTSFGAKAEIGFNQYYSNKFIVGLNFSYLINFSDVGQGEPVLGYINLNKFQNNTFLLMLSIGFRIR